MTKIRFFLLFVGILTIMKGFALPNVLPVDGLKRWSSFIDGYEDLKIPPQLQTQDTHKGLVRIVLDSIDLVAFANSFERADCKIEYKLMALAFPGMKILVRTDTVASDTLEDFQREIFQVKSYLSYTPDSLFSIKDAPPITLGKKTDTKGLFNSLGWFLLVLGLWWFLLRTCTKKSFLNLIKVGLLFLVLLFFVFLFFSQGWFWGLFALGAVIFVSYYGKEKAYRQKWKERLRVRLFAFWKSARSLFSEIVAYYWGCFPFRADQSPESDLDLAENKNKAENLHDCP